LIPIRAKRVPDLAFATASWFRRHGRAEIGRERGEATEGDRRRLGELKLTLDQCWDLLRQGCALEKFGLDADAARVRPPDVVERYEQ
jgi:hypothetical protein